MFMLYIIYIYGKWKKTSKNNNKNFPNICTSRTYIFQSMFFKLNVPNPHLFSLKYNFPPVPHP